MHMCTLLSFSAHQFQVGKCPFKTTWQLPILCIDVSQHFMYVMVRDFIMSCNFLIFLTFAFCHYPVLFADINVPTRILNPSGAKL